MAALAGALALDARVACGTAGGFVAGLAGGFADALGFEAVFFFATGAAASAG